MVSNLYVYLLQLQDNGQMQIKHLTQILSAIIKWIEPADLILEAITTEHRDRFRQALANLLIMLIPF